MSRQKQNQLHKPAEATRTPANSAHILQRAAVNTDEIEEVPEIVYDVLRSPGQPLDMQTRAYMEPRFGQDFSGVRVHTGGQVQHALRIGAPDDLCELQAEQQAQRVVSQSESAQTDDERYDFTGVHVHTGSQAAESAAAVNARAYTVGRDVVFGAGEYAPETISGKRLLAHELTHVAQQDKGRKTCAIYLASSHTQRKVDFKEGTTITGQSLDTHLYDEVESGMTTEPAPGIRIGFYYRIYKARPNVNIAQLYDNLTTLYGHGRFHILTPAIAAYLNARTMPRANHFFALYPNRRSREPILLTRLEDLKHGFASPHEVTRPGITAGFTERKDVAWTTLSPTARNYVNDWKISALEALDLFLDDIPLEEDRSVQNVLTVLGNVAWALTAFVPPLYGTLIGGISLVGALTSSFASISPGSDLKGERKTRIKKIEKKALFDEADKLLSATHLSPVLITVLVKSQERDALLWDHMYDNIPYESEKEGHSVGIFNRIYGTLKRKFEYK